MRDILKFLTRFNRKSYNSNGIIKLKKIER
jgi:hypothetical protein